MAGKFDELTNEKALRAECESLYSQLLMHQKQIKQLKQDLYFASIMHEATNMFSIEVPSEVTNQQEFNRWVHEDIKSPSSNSR